MTPGLIREIFYVLISVLTAYFIIAMIFDRRNKKEINRLTEYAIHVNANTADLIPDEIIENLIQDCFNEYIILNIAYKNITYIDSELEIKIIKEVGSMVAQRISPALLDKISMYYNMKVFSDIISNKVYLVVMNYVTETNSIKENIPADPNQ